MRGSYFVTGTDTGCGKTEVTLGLMSGLQQQGCSVAGMKPVASGARQIGLALYNADALRIQHQASFEVPYSEVNPFVYQPAIAPHLAAKRNGQSIVVNEIQKIFQRLDKRADHVLVEGVGGWHVPLGDNTTVADLALALNLPVILVVGIRLGCLNHALLTAESILHTGACFAGWVANHLDPEMMAADDNFVTLKNWLPAPCLGEVPYLSKPAPEIVAEYLT
jgi:dethiobiotin synthetase